MSAISIHDSNGRVFPLIDRAVDELRRRDPAFLRWHDVSVRADAIDELVLRCDPKQTWLDDSARVEYSQAAADYCAKALRTAHIVPATQESEPCYEVSDQLARACAEAILVEHGAMRLDVETLHDADVFDESILAEYDEVKTAVGRCFVRKHGQRTVLLVNALGIPLSIWSSFLLDRHDYRIVVPEMSCGDVFFGGMTSSHSAREHAAHIDALLSAAGIDTFDVIAWCNGGRIAIELASLVGNRIGKLIFLSPTFRGADTMRGTASDYENKLEQIFSVVRRNPKAAGYVAGMLTQLTAAPDWGKLPRDDSTRARFLFGLPASDRTTSLIAPMTGADNLCNYAARTSADEALSDSRVTLRSDVDVHLICGDFDAVISNEHTQAYMRRCTSKLGFHMVLGAGHYVHDLQYPYFRWIIDRIFNGSTHGCQPLRVENMN